MRPEKSNRSLLDGVASIRRKPPTRDHRSRPARVRLVPEPVAISETPPTAKRAGDQPEHRHLEGVPDRDDQHQAEADQHQQAAEAAEPVVTMFPEVLAQVSTLLSKRSISVLEPLPGRDVLLAAP